MRKVMTLLCLLIGISWASAQTKVTGVVTSADDGQPVIGASVVVKGTTLGTITDVNGKFSVTVPANDKTLVFSYVGMVQQELAAQPNMRVTMRATAQQMNEVVVTALGISRDKKSLGYATQEITGSTLSVAKPNNLINSLSGRVSGVDIKSSGNLGGSTNIIIRGNKSLMGSNQALFIVDGVPITNATSNSTYQTTGGQGYDYGSAVSDIDPNDIESISVLKGAAATALYGSRAANGVIMITTKSGRDDKNLGKHGIGVSFSSNLTLGTIDRSTFPQYQNQYGAGYGPYYSGGGDGSQYPGFYYGSLPWTNGSNVYYVPTTEDASYGTKFDPNLKVYQWDAFVPESPNYQKATPWVAAKNGPITFFNTAVTTSNTLSLNGASAISAFRFSYTNFRQNGILPNSQLTKNTFDLNVSRKLTQNFTVSSNANFTHQNTVGRNGTGYMGNIMTSFRQWWETNVDVKELKALYDKTGRNVTWNMSDPANGNTTPIYWNNYYWERYNNYENDSRSHLFGNVQLKWDITKYLNIIGRVALDTYSQLQEEHLGLGSVPAAFGIGLLSVPSGYSRENINFMETNYDLLINFNKNLTDKLNLTALAGGNMRRNNQSSIYASTNGGLTVPGLNAIANSVSPPLAPIEAQSAIGVNGIFGSVSLGYDNTYYLDGTLRADRSSTLPIANDTYYYPSISGSFIFTNLWKPEWVTFGKIRLNYAEVGNGAPFASLYDTYSQPSPFGAIPMYSVNSTENNPTLKPERTKSSEAGLEMSFLNKRVGFDADVYLTNTIDQIMPVAVSPATGYSFKYVNSGEVRNQGIELNLYGTPIQSKAFSWNINVNWSANVNKVVSLYEGVPNLQLGSFQGGVTIDAAVGHPYGLIEGTDFVYNKSGQKEIGSNGYYLISSTTNNVIGNSNPKWHAGITNSFTFKNWTASFLVDIQHGGSIFSLDQYYGLSDGIYPVSVGNNDLGNPMRNTLANGGGIILPGVLSDGVTLNTKRITADRYTVMGYPHMPNSAFIYDASYVKLREAEISYNFQSATLNNIGIRSLSLGLVGSNLWMISKKLPYADPESGLGAGNMQGWQGGVMPTTRNFGFNLKVQF